MWDRSRGPASALPSHASTYKLMMAVLKSSTRNTRTYRTRTKALAFAFACLLTASCRHNPPEPIALREQTAVEAVENLAKYAAWLRSRTGAELNQEQARLEAMPESSERSVRLALLHAVRPDPALFAVNEELQKQAAALQAQLAAETQQRQTLESDLALSRQQQETERIEREKLERKLRALKTLEAQIKDRDEAISN